MQRASCALLLAGLLHSASASTSGTEQADVLAAIDRTFRALRAGDIDGYLPLMMPVVHATFAPDGMASYTHDDWRTLFGRGNVYDWVPRRLDVQVHGTTAAAAGYVHGTIRLRSGMVIGGPWSYSEVRVRDGGAWKLLQQHFSALVSGGEQTADPAFVPSITNARFPAGTGPPVLIDEAHFNMHTAWGSYRPFAELLRQDGYVVREWSATFGSEPLPRDAVLVIANAQNRDRHDLTPQPLPALTADEVTSLVEWIRAGGSLLWLVDHNPYPAHVENLAAALGLRFLNCGATRENLTSGRLVFRRVKDGEPGEPIGRGADSVAHGWGGWLHDHPLTSGVDSVATFLGSAFVAGGPHQPILEFGSGVGCHAGTNQDAIPVQGHLQGAAFSAGKGRVAVFAEAGLFTAQWNRLAGTKMGMNNPIASQNERLLLNVVRWLSDPAGPR